MPLAPGTHLGPYEIDSPLGSGGMGEVYKARDTRLPRTVAIKVLPEHVAADPARKRRFEIEAKAVSSLNHPHICTLHDVGHHEGTDYLVLEYLEGETLADRLARSPLDVGQALTIAIQIASALAQAHRAGLVHRDLKPANIFLVRKGPSSGQPIAKLLDFGLAKSSAPVVSGSALSMLPTTPPGITVQGSILGTFQYMAPEQIEGLDADARTDIFAFGIVLFEMLAGRPAFEGRTRAALLGAILKDQPPPLSQIRPGVPAALDRIVSTCLAKEPDDRWQTARDLLRELQWAADGADGNVDTRALSIPSPSKRRSLAWAAMAIGLLAFVVLAVPALMYWRDSRGESPVMRLELSTPPTTDSLSFALSPDGTQIAFVATSDGRTRLWLRKLDSPASRPLERTDGAASPFWSPDSRSVAFFADQKLKRIDVDAGSVQTLADANGAAGGTWGPNDTIVFTPGPAQGLAKVSSLGGAISPVTMVGKDQQGHRYPEFLPDGQHFLFFVRGADTIRGIYVSGLDGMTPTRLLDGDAAGGVYVVGPTIFYVRQGTLFTQGFDTKRLALTGTPVPLADQVGVSSAGRAALSVSHDGLLAYRTTVIDSRRQFIWFARTGKMLEALGAPDDNRGFSPQLSPDGSQLAMHRSASGNVDIYLLDAHRGVLSRLTADPASELTPVWSPDGTRLAFAAFRDGNFEMRVRTLANGNEEALHVNGLPADWSHDGFLLYGGVGNRFVRGLSAMSLDQRKPFTIAESGTGRGQFSPDGKWVAYESTESGRHEIYVQAFPNGIGKVRVSTNGGAQPRWNPNGRELFYVALDDRLMTVPMRTRAEGTPDPEPPIALFSTHIGGAVQELTSATYMVSSDGQRFLMNTLVEEPRIDPIRFILTRKRN